MKGRAYFSAIGKAAIILIWFSHSSKEINFFVRGQMTIPGL
jgi:hypothetical protein